MAVVVGSSPVTGAVAFSAAVAKGFLQIIVGTQDLDSSKRILKNPSTILKTICRPFFSADDF